MNSNNSMLEKVGRSFFDFLETFKTDLIGEVKKAMQEEMAAVQSAAKSPDQTLTRQEAAKLLDCSFTTLCHYQRQGIIPFYKVGKKVLFKREEVLEAIRHQVRKGARHEK